MSCGGCCCGGPDLRTPEEKRACEARRATMVLRVFVWGIILTALAVLAFMVGKLKCGVDCVCTDCPARLAQEMELRN